MRLAICAVFLVCASGFAAYAQGTASTPVPVGTVTAERKAISKGWEFVGRVEAINRVDVRARVKGYLEAVLFREGDLVKEGDPLYRIEKGLFEAAVGQAEGALQKSKAEYELAVKTRQRQEELFSKNVTAEQKLDEARAAEGKEKGNVSTDEANLKAARINLSYTDILAPIAGKIGRTALTKGNVISPESGVLTTIVSQDPMYVTFPVSQREFVEAQENGRRGDLDFNDIKVRLRYSDGSMYDQVGQFNFVDVSVDRATDTVLMRATIPNPKGGLTDGQIMRVMVEGGTPEEKIMIPQAALIADQEGVYVFVVEDGKAVVKRVKPGGEHGTIVVIESGLSAGDLVIVQGLDGVRPGTAVRASPLPQALRQG
jgi:membrane fusion protein (multidrug efflux system)